MFLERKTCHFADITYSNPVVRLSDIQMIPRRESENSRTAQSALHVLCGVHHDFIGV